MGTSSLRFREVIVDIVDDDDVAYERIEIDLEICTLFANVGSWE